MKNENHKHLILALETAQYGGSVSLLDRNGVRAALSGEKQSSRAEELTSLVENLLEKAGAAKSDLASIAVSNGPGSLTGIRIGLAFARGLSDALTIPLREISVLHAIAAVCGTAGEGIATVPSGKNELSYGCFDSSLESGSAPSFSNEPVRASFENFVEFVREKGNDGLSLAAPKELVEALHGELRKNIINENLKLLVAPENLSIAVGFTALSGAGGGAKGGFEEFLQM